MTGLRRGELIFHYGGRHNDITADTLIHSLTSITTIIQTVNKELGSGKRLDIKIKAREPGSFELLTVLGFLESVKTLLTLENFKTIGELIGAVVAFFKLRKEEAKLGKDILQERVKHNSIEGNITFQDSDGSNITINQNVFNFYFESQPLRAAMDKNFEVLERDPHVTDFAIRDKQGAALFEAKRKDFSKLVTEREPQKLERPAEELELQTIRTKVTVVRPSFYPELPWDVIFQGNKVSARMDDEEFKQRVAARREYFGAGDTLDCEFQIKRTLDTAANVMVNKSYRILEVHKHKPAGQQLNLSQDLDPEVDQEEGKRKRKPTRQIRFDVD